jgi:ABC-2 type transport system permease protein
VSADILSTTEGAFARILSKKARPQAPSAVSSSVTLGWRALLKIKHVPFQLFDVTAFPIMMTILFSVLFGGALGGTVENVEAGEDARLAYLQFFIPGVVVQAIIFITVYTGVGLATDINKGIFDRFRSLAIWQPSPVFGAILGDLVRYSIAAFVVIVLGVALGFRPDGGILGVLAAVGLVLVFAISVSWIWMVVGMKVKTPESVMATSFLFLFPLTFVTNIFVPLSTMPEWLQAVVLANPVTHLVSAVRGLMHGWDVLADVGWVLLASVVTSAIFAPLALRLYRKER